MRNAEKQSKAALTAIRAICTTDWCKGSTSDFDSDSSSSNLLSVASASKVAKLKKGGDMLQKGQKRKGKPAKRNERAKARRLKLGLRALDVADYLGITIQSFIGKEKGEQPWRWGEIKKLIKLYDIKSIDELLRIF